MTRWATLLVAGVFLVVGGCDGGGGSGGMGGGDMSGSDLGGGGPRGCAAQPAITQWRVDPNTITYVDYSCR